MAKAYLIVSLCFDASKPIPHFHGIHIKSAPADQLTGLIGIMWAEVMQSPEAETYAEAKEWMMNVINTVDDLAWVRAWLDPSYEAHQKRWHIDLELSRRLEAWKNGVDMVVDTSEEAVEAKAYELYCAYKTIDHKPTANFLGLWTAESPREHKRWKAAARKQLERK